MHSWIADRLGGVRSLRRKILSGGGWLLGRSAALGVIDLTRTAVFARILDANDYGLMALVTMVTGMISATTFLGLDALVQRDGGSAVRNFPVYWTIKMMRGCVCFVVALALAPVVAAYYTRPELSFLIRLLGIQMLIEGASGFGKEKCQLEMNFGRMVRAEVILSLLSLGLGTVAVMLMKSVTALVINQLLTAVVQWLLSYLLFPWRPSLRWNRDLFNKVMVFSSSIIAINILNYVNTSFDRATIGKLYDLETLGFYARGHFLSQIPVSYISLVIAPVFMPAFKKIGDDPRRLRGALMKVMLTYALFFALFGAGLAIFADAFVVLIYGKKWLPVVPVFRILLLYGTSKSIVSACQPVFFLRDRPWLVSINTGVMVAVFCALCIPLTKNFGIEGTAWSVVAGALVSHVLAVVQAFRIIAIADARQVSA